MRRVLFVCTGNIFRSLTAEYALRAALRENAEIHVSSAGTDDYPHVVRPEVRAYLLEKGLDVRPHVRRTLTQALVDESHLLIVMGTDHRDALKQAFGRSVPLYLEACGEAAEGLPDIEEVIADYRTNPAAVTAHVRQTIDRIIELAPRLAERMPQLLRQHGRD
jgi:protein-tyrosine phosphatase